MRLVTIKIHVVHVAASFSYIQTLKMQQQNITE